MLDVVEIITESVLQRSVTPESMNRCPSRQARFAAVAKIVIVNGVAELLHELGTFGTRPHQTHLSLEDIPELGQFI